MPQRLIISPRSTKGAGIFLETVPMTDPTQATRADQVRWQRVNAEPFEYAIQQGPHGDEFVKLLDGSCLRRPAQSQNSAPACNTSQNIAESGPSVTTPVVGAETAVPPQSGPAQRTPSIEHLQELLRQRDVDISNLISELRALEEATGESLEDEDASLIAHIEACLYL